MDINTPLHQDKKAIISEPLDLDGLRAEDKDEVNLLEVAQNLWQGRWVIASTTFLGAVIAIFMALTAPLQYRAEVLLAPASAHQGQMSQLSSQFGGLASLVGIDLGGGKTSTLDSYLATLKSRKFIQKFVEEQGLLPVLFAPGQKPTTWQIYQKFNSRFMVSKDIKTGLVTISVVSSKPEETALWANQLVQTLNRYIREETIAEGKKSLNYLQQQIQQTSLVGMQEILYKLVEQQIQMITLAEVREQFAFSVIDPAVVPDQREKPKRKQMVQIGIILGFLIGIFVVLVLNAIRQRFPEKDWSLKQFVKEGKVDWLKWLKHPQSRL